MLNFVSSVIAGGLAAMELQAAVLATTRYLRPGNPVSGDPRDSTRRLVLLSFIVYMVGGVVLNGNAGVFGSFDWPIEAKWVAVLGRAVQMFGAGLFVWTVTSAQCGAWVTIGSVLMSVCAGLLMASRL